MRGVMTAGAALALLGGGVGLAYVNESEQHVNDAAGSVRQVTATDRQTAHPTPELSSASAFPGPRRGVVVSGRPRSTPVTRSAAPTPSPSPSPSVTRTPAPAAPPPPSALSSPALQVLADINQARAAQGLPAYTMSDGLIRSAAAHNATMAAGCGLSHQCPGEAALGDRETVQGVQWSSAGENIGQASGIGSSPQEIASAAVGLTRSMLAEQPPDDGHRQNILSSTFTHIGIAVRRDADGTVWLTQDFSG